MTYEWPGNVRELENTIEFAFVTCRTDCIRTTNIPEQINFSGPKIKRHGKDHAIAKTDIIQALKTTNGNKTRAAELLGYSRITLWKKMNKLGLTEKIINF